MAAAATPEINVAPRPLDLKLYAGDGISIEFVFTKSDGSPWPADGTWASQIRAPATSDPPILTFVVDESDQALGKVRISLSGDQVRSLLDVSGAEWDIQQTPPGAEPRTWYKGKVRATQDVTRA